MSPQRQKHRLFEVLIQLLECFAARGPVLLVVEDLHWVDPTSDELIGILIDRLKDLPILAILTARPEFQSHWDDRAHLLHMQLSPLERDDSIAMIELLCGDRKIPAPTIRQIADKTDGMPLFIEDLTRDLLETADQPQTDGGRLTRPARSPFTIPSTLTDSLMSRLDRLGSAKTIAQISAVIGRETSFQLLAKVADVAGGDPQGGAVPPGRLGPAGQPPLDRGVGVRVQARAGSRRGVFEPAEKGAGVAALRASPRS